ncbi:hypothetical protein BSL78_27293 [Apostichopus japonicus]|uniref:Uncharacterized protein n=1 Tax=Stichopus japonicus TaxID=307972 RepID=A0A2G8JJI3_STIJA|nr:hypothetical protein BSL78_27293 [Apostichopus japonicus]
MHHTDCQVLRECNTDNEPERAPGESECTTQIAKKNTNQNKPPEVLRECNTDNEPERAPGESECTTQIVKKQTNQNKPPEVLRECNTDNEPERAPGESECTTQIAKKNTNQNKPPEVLRECNTDNEPERAPGESECTTQIVKKNTNQNKPPEVLRECNTDNEPERAHVESNCTTQIAKKQTNQNKPPEVLRECNTDNEPERAPGESECTTQIAKDNESDDSYNPFEDIDLFPWCKDTHKDVSSGGDDKGENEDSTNSSEYMIPLPSPKMRSHGAVCIKEHPSKSDVEHTIVSTTDHNQKQQQRHGKNRKCNQKKVRFALEKEESVSYTDSSDSSDENNEHCSDYLPTESSSDEQMSPESNSEMDTQKRKGPGTSLKRNVDMRSSASDSEAGGNIVHSTSSSSSKLRLQNAECKVSSKTPESSCAVSSTTSETRFKKIPRVTVMTSSNGLLENGINTSSVFFVWNKRQNWEDISSLCMHMNRVPDTIPCTEVRPFPKKSAAIQKVAGIKLEDGELKDYAERFEELCNLEWADSVSSHALSTLYQRKWNKPTILPLSEDVVNLHKHLNVKITESTKRLSTDPDKLAWYSLATATMAKIILFNRRRSGEVQRMPLEDYQRCNTHTNEDILEDLTEWEKKLCQQLSRVETKGKRGRKVPILLTSEMKEAAIPL